MFKSGLNIILDSFDFISLNEMDRVKLMNRVEKKYVFPANRLPELMSMLKDSYRVLDMEHLRFFQYSTTYLDTPDFLFFNQQVRGKLNRYKVRYRRYESTGTSFLEIKKKTNKSRTIKWRIENHLKPDSPDNEAKSFIRKYLPDRLPDLQPVLINSFSRITLVGKEINERITLDFDITFASPYGKITGLPFLAIAELKHEKYNCASPFGSAMKKMCIQPGRFSKYCIGSALIMDMPRKNRLKPNLLLINKIENEYSKSDRA
jgi:hypothetical protein